MWPDYVEVFPFYTHFVCFNHKWILYLVKCFGIYWYDRGYGAESHTCGFVFFPWWLWLLDCSHHPLHCFSISVPGLSLSVHQLLWPSGLLTAGQHQPSTTTEFSEAQRVLDCFCSSPLSFPLPDSPACSSTPLSDVQCTDLSDLFVVLSRESLIVPLGTWRGKTKRFLTLTWCWCHYLIFVLRVTLYTK